MHALGRRRTHERGCGVQALLHQCRASEYMLTPQQMLPPMLAKVSTIVDNASTIFTFLRSQLPFPYVHLVSFTVHFYLFFWATYMGMLLHTGIPDGTVTQSATTQPLSVGTAADDAWVRPPPGLLPHSHTKPPCTSRVVSVHLGRGRRVSSGGPLLSVSA